MNRRLRELIPVKPEERFITFVMFFYIFGVLCFYYILDPLRLAKFLEKPDDVTRLPYAYLLTAAVAGTIASVILKLSRRWSAISLLTGLNLAIIGTLFCFRWAWGRDIWYLPWVYFVYGKTVPVLSTTQFWLMAGYIYDNRQAKRIYGVLGLGAGLGAIVGSLVPTLLSKLLDPQTMILICMEICALLILLSHLSWRYRRADAEVRIKPAGHEHDSKNRFADLWRLVFGSSHLAMMAVLIFVTLIASQIAEWQNTSVASATINAATPEELRSSKITEFFGTFNLITNIIGILVQILGVRFVIKRYGVLAAILLLPVCLFVSSAGVFLYPMALAATVIARGSDTVCRYSFNRVGLELLWMPVTPAARKKLKIFLDVFVDRFGRASAAIVILVFTSQWFPVGLRGTATVAMMLTFVSVLVCLQLRKTYVHAFREKLRRREVDLGDLSNYVTDPSSVQLLVDTLEGNNERQILYSLQLLQSVRGFDFSKKLLPLLSHPKSYVRQETVKTLQALPGDYSAEAERMLADISREGRFAAIDYLCSRDGVQAQNLASLLRHADMDVRLDAARWAGEHAGPAFQPAPELLRGLLTLAGPRGPEARAIAAGLTPRLPRVQAGELLRRLIEDRSPEVAAAAAVAAGKGGHHDLLFPILAMLTAAKSREAARSALLAYGDRIIGTLGDVLGDERSDLAMRREIPWVLGRIPAERAADRLIDNLGAADPQLRFRVVKALNRLHESHPQIPISHAAVNVRIDAEIRAYYEGVALGLAIEAGETGTSRRLLPRALREHLNQNLELLFRLLGLRYAQKEMHSAYAALKGSRADRRTAAIELLDNLLPPNQKSMILPLLEESSAAALVERARSQFGISPLQRNDALKLLLSLPDAWLAACALHEIGEHRIRELADSCRNRVDDADPWIRETAGWALARC